MSQSANFYYILSVADWALFWDINLVDVAVSSWMTQLVIQYIEDVVIFYKIMQMQL